MAVPDSSPIVRASGGGAQLARDTRLAFMLLNEARYRGMASLFGCSRDQANLATLVAALALAEATRVRIRRWMTGPPLPSAGDALIWTGSVRAGLSAAAGTSVQESPQLGTLLLLAVIAGGAAPAVIRSLNGLRGFGHELNRHFRHRYGYLVDPGHRRREHYEAHARKASAEDLVGEAGVAP